MCIYIHIYIYIYVHVCVCMYIYIYTYVKQGPNNIKYHKPCFSCLLCSKSLDSHFAERKSFFSSILKDLFSYTILFCVVIHLSPSNCAIHEMCVYVCVFVCVCMFVCLCVCVCVCVCVLLHASRCDRYRVGAECW